MGYCRNCKFRGEMIIATKEQKRRISLNSRQCFLNWGDQTKIPEILYIIKCKVSHTRGGSGPGLSKGWFWADWEWPCYSFQEETQFITMMKDSIDIRGDK